MWATVFYTHNTKEPFIYISAQIEAGALINIKRFKGGKEKLREYKKEFLQDIIEAAQRELEKLNQ